MGFPPNFKGLTNQQMREIARRMIELIPDDDELADTDELSHLNMRITLDVVAESFGLTAEELLSGVNLAGFARGAAATADEIVDNAMEAVEAVQKGPS